MEEKGKILNLRKDKLGRLEEMPELDFKEIEYISPVGEPIILAVMKIGDKESLRKIVSDSIPKGANAYLDGKTFSENNANYVHIQYYKVPTLLIQRAIMRKFSAMGFP